MKITHVIPNTWGAYVDVWAMWSAYSARVPGVKVITPAEYQAMFQAEALAPYALYILWDETSPGSRDRRHPSTKVAHVYSEALDEDGTKLLPDHLAHWHRFKDRAHDFDAVFTHTERTRAIVARGVSCPVFVMPLGYDAMMMGAPRWSSPVRTDLIYQGSLAGRRKMILPYLKGKLGSRLHDATGSFGRALLGQMDHARASLYIAHSAIESFSTWRLWQCAATSCALIAEQPDDIWPFDDSCVIAIPRITPDNADRVVAEIDDVLLQGPWRQKEAARQLHAIACDYPLTRVENEYIYPALERILS